MRLTFNWAQWLPVAKVSYKCARWTQHRWQSTIPASTPSPAPKKLGWSQLEESKLSDFIQSGRRDWSYMARELGRTTDSVRAHYRHILQPRTGVKANVGRNAGLRMTQSEVSHMSALAQKGYEIGAIAKIMQRDPRTISTRLKNLKSRGRSYVEIAQALRTIPSKARERLKWHTRQARLSASVENRRAVCELRDQGESIAEIAAQTGLKLAVATRYANVPDEHTKLNAPGPARKWTREDMSSLAKIYNAGSPLKEIAQRLQRSFSIIVHAVRRAAEGGQIPRRRLARKSLVPYSVSDLGLVSQMRNEGKGWAHIARCLPNNRDGESVRHAYARWKRDGLLQEHSDREMSKEDSTLSRAIAQD